MSTNEGHDDDAGEIRADKFTVDAGDLVFSQCVYCRHRVRRRPGGLAPAPVCAAFPGHIPREILENTVDHRLPYEGDEGIRFQPLEDLTPQDLAGLYRELDALHKPGGG